jgi:hypothetical protein
MKKAACISLFVLALILFVNPVALKGQTYKPGLQDFTFFSSVDETNQPYAIYIPENFDETREYQNLKRMH